MQENEKSKQKKQKCTKRCNHKYEICLLEMTLKNSCPIHISQMYNYVFNEEEMKKGKENKKKKTRREKALPFF